MHRTQYALCHHRECTTRNFSPWMEDSVRYSDTVPLKEDELRFPTAMQRN